MAMHVLKLAAAIGSTLLLALIGATSAEAANPIAHNTIVSGLEYSATATQGNFAGTATPGSPNGLAGTWSIVVYHTPLGSENCDGTRCAHILNDPSHDSSFSLLTASPAIGFVTGKFQDPSSSNNRIVQVGADTSCGTQHYQISDDLTAVGPAGSPHSGSGTFFADLWHYRYSLPFGRGCITYSAFVKGKVVLTY
jgi:hypothetical protein